VFRQGKVKSSTNLTPFSPCRHDRLRRDINSLGRGHPGLIHHVHSFTIKCPNQLTPTCFESRMSKLQFGGFLAVGPIRLCSAYAKGNSPMKPLEPSHLHHQLRLRSLVILRTSPEPYRLIDATNAAVCTMVRCCNFRSHAASTSSPPFASTVTSSGSMISLGCLCTSWMGPWMP
jgi:hypothetical protein